MRSSPPSPMIKAAHPGEKLHWVTTSNDRRCRSRMIAGPFDNLDPQRVSLCYVVAGLMPTTCGMIGLQKYGRRGKTTSMLATHTFRFGSNPIIENCVDAVQTDRESGAEAGARAGASALSSAKL